MTELAGADAVTDTVRAEQLEAGDPSGPLYSKDYWDLVFEQLQKRKLFKVGIAILAVLYAVAIYAPLIANDRPFSLSAIDYKGYNGELRSLSAVTSSVARLLAQTEAEYLAGRSDTSPETFAAALDVEREAALSRIDTLQAYLPAAEHGPLDEFVVLLDSAIATGLAGDVENAKTLGDEAKTSARSIKREYKAREPDAESEEGKELVPVTSHPLWKSVSPGEIFFMVLWALILTWPIWNRFVNRLVLNGDRDRIRHWRRRKLAFVLGVSIGAALLWTGTVGGKRATFDAAPYKAALTEGTIVATVPPVFPPIATGYAETHTEEGFRPPTWTKNSALDEDGHYMFGRRIPKEDPITGAFPSPTPVQVRYGEPERNAALRHIAGTDELGRDFLVRMIWGARVSLSVGILSAFLLTVIGVVIGSIAGYFGGPVDTAIMRTIEILQSIPAFFLILLAMAFTDPEVVPPIFAIVVVIAIIRWTGAARLVRGEFLKLREQEFVLAARALGFSPWRTIFRHVLPNAMSPLLVNAAFAVAAGILTESAISFLGFGVQHPGASWGSLVNESKSASHWWIQVFPGLLIFMTVTCYNLVGDAVRDALDPKMKV